MFKHEKMLFHPVAVEKPNPLKCISQCQTLAQTHLQ